MDKKTKLWISLMHIFDKYWGCHQIAERSFFIKGYQFPVCARCTGIIIGEVAFIIFTLLSFRINIIFSLLFMIPLIIDGTLQLKTSYVSNNIKRLFSGMFFGFGFFSTVFCLIIILL